MSDVHSPAVSAHEEAADHLRAELRRNWKVGDRLPPIKELAARLGLGQTNTHRAAQLLAAEGLLVARPRRGTFVARIPRHRTIVSRRRALLLQLDWQRTDRFMQPAVEVMTRRLAQSNIIVEVMTIDIHYKQLDSRVLEEFEALVTLQPSGGVMLANDPRRPAVVLTTAEVEPMALMEGYDVVSVDSLQGAMLAGRWLRDRGFTRVGFIGVCATRENATYEPTSFKRLYGFEEGLGRVIPEADRLVSDAFRPGAGAEVFEKYAAMADPPRTLFCASDDLAVGFMHAAHIRGLRPGYDYDIVGFDGQVRGQTAPDGPLTTVLAPVEQMGRTAAELLVTRLAETTLPVRRVLLACEMFEGITVRRPVVE